MFYILVFLVLVKFYKRSNALWLYYMNKMLIFLCVIGLISMFYRLNIK